MTDDRVESPAESLDIAVMGMAGRFPGARDIREFWRNIAAGIESITFFTDEELARSGVAPELLAHPDYVKAAPVLDGIELFDAPFFGYSPREAAILDPQQRLFLRAAWEALENAGYDGETYDGAIGVFGGSSLPHYMISNLLAGRSLSASGEAFHVLIGNDKDYLTTRVSYKLNLKGPSVAVQTACSTSLVAVQLACQSLLSYQCDMALAGGVSVRVPQTAGYLRQDDMIFSPDGHCRTFDVKARGTLFGSGVGVVVLKRLADALRDGDSIAAVVKGSAINNDGSVKIGYTAPSAETQAEVIASALAMAGVEPSTVTCIEAHGTGTQLGDPIEVSALTRVFRESTPDSGFCAIGSVKSNVGHLETAAGVASLIKMVQALEHRTLPPTLHFDEPNPQIDFARSPFYVNTEARPWETAGFPRRAGVSSFGIGGTNAHVVLEEAPEVAPGDPGKRWELLVWSARTESALDRMTANLAAWLEENPAANLADVAATLQRGRRAFACRRMAVCRDLEDTRRTLEALDSERVSSSYQTGRDRPVAFLFSGQGAQYPGMGRELYELEPVYRREVDRCCEQLRPYLGFDLRQALYPAPEAAEEAGRRLAQTAVTQPALFVTEYSLARLLASWGIEPQAMIGHSIGEYVAACLAGVFPLDAALRLVAERGRLMQGLPGGSMLSVPLPAAEIEPLLAGTGLSLAAVNAPDLCVVAGPDDAAATWQARLAAERGVEARRLHTSHAFHSAMMDPILEPFAVAVRRTVLAPPHIPFVSNVTGTWITAEEATSPDYWTRHLRQPVRFAAGAAELLTGSDSNLLEVGPGRTLVTFVRRQVPPGEERGIAATLRHPGDEVPDLAFLYTALGRLWLAGSRPDWQALHGGTRRRRLPLPSYPFEERRYWIEARPAAGAPGALEIAFEADVGETESRAGLRSSYVEPRSDLERRIAAIWRRKLGVARVGVHDNFFELGGHSLLATQVQAEVNELFETRISLRRLFEKPTVAGVAAVLEESGTSAPAAMEAPVSDLPSVVVDPAARYEPFPLTDMQQAQWIGRISAFNMGNIAAHVYFEAESRGLELDRLQEAWQRMIERHEMLRAVVLPDGRQQILREVPPYPFETLDLRGVPAAEAERRRLAVRERMSHQVRPADKWPLFEIRASLLGGSSDIRLRLHVSFDLMICDVASLRILFREWSHLYEHPEVPLPVLDLSFRDYVTAEQQLHETESYRRSLDYWRRRVPDLPPAPQLPLAKSPGDLTRPRFARWSHQMDAASWQRLKARAAQMGLSGSAVVLAAYVELLSVWSRSPRFCINSTIINRLPLHPQVHEVIGEFASFAPTAVETPARFTFAELAHNLQEQSWQDLEHRYISGVRILRELARLQGGTEGATLPVVLTSTLVHSAHEAGLAAWLGDMVYAISQTPQVWLDHSVFEDRRGLLMSWHAAVELFPDGMLDDMWDSYVRLFHRLADEEEIWYRRTLDLVPEAHLEQRRRINATEAPVFDALLHTPFAAWAALEPGRPAVVAPGRTLTYGDLARRSYQLGHRLRDLGVVPNQLVAVVMEKGWEQVVAVLGVLAAGGAYVGIEAGVPEERLRYLLEHSQAAIVLTQPDLLAALPWPDGVRVLALDADLTLLDGLEDSPLAPVQGPDDLAYVIYTSGSTGLPKGVVISHRGAVNTILDINERFAVGPEDRVLALSSLAFDLSVYDIFGLLAAGGAVVLPQPGSKRDPEHWLDLAMREGVTLWNSVPALMEIFVEYAANRPWVPPLRLVLMSGDWIPVTLPGRLRKLVEGIQVISLGGATEASIWSIHYPIGDVDPAWDSIPYGKPLRNQRFHVLDPALEPCPIYVPGDLYIGGTGLALGYWRDEAKTQASFFVHPATGERLYRTGDLGRYLPDGSIEFLGREDFQVKILGHRIELGEIEASLLAHRAVRSAVVHARGEQRGKKRLAAYVVPEAGAPAEVSELRRHLAERLPDYMIPADFVLLAELPLTANGKVDRNALPDPERVESGASEGAEGELPIDGPVEDLVRIFAQVLGTEQVGIHDNFFELGGDSILGIQLVNRLNEDGLHITPQQLFEHQTIAGLAAVAAASPSSSAEQGLVTGPMPLTPFERRFLDEHPEPGAAAQWVVVELADGVDPVLLSRAVQQLITHHDALRLRVERTGGEWRQSGAPDEQAVHLARVRLSAPDAAAVGSAGEEALDQLRRELSGRLDLARGPLVAGAHVDRSDDEPSLLVLVAHPLAVDVHSWRLLLDDLETAYAKLDRGESVELPAKTVSFKRWAESLAERARSPEVQAEASYWLDDARTWVHWAGLAGVNAVRPGDILSLRVTLGEEDTYALLGEALLPYNNQFTELLLTALVDAAGRFTGSDALRVDYQVCGRAVAAGELDLSRTVGCFTTAVPLVLDLAGTGEPGDRLRAVKEQVRSMPQHGLGYGLLRYGEPGSEVAGHLAALPCPEIIFQDLGNRDCLLPAGCVCRRVRAASAFEADPLAGHGGLLRVASYLSGGRLTLVWSFPAALRAVAEPLSRACLEALQALVAHCLSPEVGGFTPSDFPDAGLSQSELDRFLDFFSSSDGR